MERILFIIGQMDIGGAETFIMKMYRAIDRQRIQFDFAVSKYGYYNEEIEKLGGHIFYTTLKSRNLFKSMREITNIVRKNHYKSVIRFGTSNTSFFDLLAAKRGGATNLGVRTLSANQGSTIKRLVSFVLRPFINSIATIKFAPSKEAAASTFGSRAKRVFILNNGINFNFFKYSKNKREKIRKKLNIDESATIIGHVGRLSPEKNQIFLLNVFEKYYQNNKNSYLICVGDGPLKKNLENKAQILNVHKNVLFVGNTSLVSDYYSAFDYFLLPSIYEGMPNAIIEAQANGLACLYSENITRDCELSNNIHALTLNEDLWVQTLQKISKKRTENYMFFKMKKFLIENTIEDFVFHLTNIKY